MPSLDASTIQEILVPAALVPANGLLLLSSTARLNTVLARIRAFHHELLTTWIDDSDPDPSLEASHSQSDLPRPRTPRPTAISQIPAPSENRSCRTSA